MAAFYSVLGVNLACSHPLPRLAAEPVSGEDALDVELGNVPFDLPRHPAEGWEMVFESRHADPRGEPSLRIWRRAGGDVHRFLYSDGAEFFVDREGRHLWTRWVEPNTLEDVATYLLGPILGFVLRLRGVITLHASAVVIDGQAIALAGQAGAGKSTTAAAFAQRGYSVLSDDITAVKPAAGDFLVQADCPLLNLWPASSEMLWGSREALPRLSLTWDKRFLDLEKHGYRTERTPRPLAAVYLLRGEPVASSTAVVEELHGRRGYMALLGNTYAHLLDRQMQAYEFEVLARLLPRLSVLRLRRPARGLTPGELCDLVADDFRRRRSSAFATSTS